MVLPQLVAELLVTHGAAEFGIDALMIEHVVAVCAARSGLQIGGTINVADAEVFEIAGHFAGFEKPESGFQLQPIGAARQSFGWTRHVTFCSTAGRRSPTAEFRPSRDDCSIRSPFRRWLYSIDKSS